MAQSYYNSRLSGYKDSKIRARSISNKPTIDQTNLRETPKSKPCSYDMNSIYS